MHALKTRSSIAVLVFCCCAIQGHLPVSYAVSAMHSGLSFTSIRYVLNYNPGP